MDGVATLLASVATRMSAMHVGSCGWAQSWQSSEALALVETEEWGLRGAAGGRKLVGHGGARTRACYAAAVSAGLRPCAVWSFAPDSVAGLVEATRGEGSAMRATEAYAAGCRAWQVQLWAVAGGRAVGVFTRSGARGLQSRWSTGVFWMVCFRACFSASAVCFGGFGARVFVFGGLDGCFCMWSRGS